jgi:eukaryotic-like serine/threonine-protein kinase
MDTPRRELISHLYHAALERLADEHSVFLKDACSGDETLRVELESLFLCEPASARLLERPAFVAEAPDDIAASTLLNQQPGPFKIIARLGVGGMGEVYKALDARLGRFVALKVLHDPIAEGADQDRVLREARVCAALQHPQICVVHEIGIEDGRRYCLADWDDRDAFYHRGRSFFRTRIISQNRSRLWSIESRVPKSEMPDKEETI